MAYLLVQVLVFLFDVVAFGLAVAAEQRRSTAKLVPDSDQNYTYCVYDSDISTGYGAGALLLLLVSQIVVMVVSRCFCCGRSLRPGGSRACALILFLFCWITFIIAEACMLAGAVNNAYHTRYRYILGGNTPSCAMLRKGVFAAGAAFVFFNAIITEFYLLAFSKSRDDGPTFGASTIGMSPYK